ncbi:MAG: hypothetical protein AAGH89_19705 [Verrucomicrobiota bacterium]
MPRLIHLVVIAAIGLGFSAILAADADPQTIKEEQKREVASAGISTATKIIIVLLLFFVMSAMRTLSRKKLQRARQRRVKPWEDDGKPSGP